MASACSRQSRSRRTCVPAVLNDGSACTSDLDCPGETCSTNDDCGGGIVSVYSEALVPGLTVSVQVVSEGCDLSQENSFSDVAVMATSQWGDLLSSCEQFPCTPPGDGANINDIYGSIQAFASAPGAPRKARADTAPSFPDRRINFTSDTLRIIGAFQGLPYPFLRCETDGNRCVGGPNDGAQCTTDSDCEHEPCP